MISKNEIKYIQSLYHKKTRDEENVFVVEGPKLVDELLKSNFSIKKIYAIASDWLESTNHAAVQQITEIELARISRLETPNQVITIAEKKILKDIDCKDQITLMLDGIQDPGNLGTIIRIADWFGIKQIIASEDSVDCYNPKSVQSTMGSIFRVDVHYKNLEDFLSDNKMKVYGALLNGENIQNHASISEGILVIGNESNGIRKNILTYLEERLTIPSFGKAESLNAAVATGIILSHLVK